MSQVITIGLDIAKNVSHARDVDETYFLTARPHTVILIGSIKNGRPLAGHGVKAVREAIAGSMCKLPEKLRQSLTWKWGTMPGSASTAGGKSTSVIRKAYGSVARTRTPTACYDSASPTVPISSAILLPLLTP